MVYISGSWIHASFHMNSVSAKKSKAASKNATPSKAGYTHHSNIALSPTISSSSEAEGKSTSETKARGLNCFVQALLSKLLFRSCIILSPCLHLSYHSGFITKAKSITSLSSKANGMDRGRVSKRNSRVAKRVVEEDLTPLLHNVERAAKRAAKLLPEDRYVS